MLKKGAGMINAGADALGRGGRGGPPAMPGNGGAGTTPGRP